MLFNSFIFIFVFLPITFFVYFYLNKKRLTEASKAFLVFSSLFFYSWWNISYLPIILVSMLFNYSMGISLCKEIKVNKRVLLTVGIGVNLALLGYFKYADFLIENLNNIVDGHLPLLNLALPLAISFFTFQQIAYLVDSYRGETKEYDFLNYANFVTFFPQLIAGPIVHHAEMMPQFTKKKNKVKNYHNITLGSFIFSIGLFKKVVIADSFSVWANAGFEVATTLNFFEAWLTSLSYTFQLYFDFSGYTDMAIGAALLFNIKLPINFNSPYKAISIQDFWRRWHITLSRFLRDYVYIPLGGNRKDSFRIYMNLMATFVLGGLWHGAGWTFVFWGFLHGLALIIHRVWTKLGFKMHPLMAWFITFNFINISWVFFRAREWEDATRVLSAMFHVDLHAQPYLAKIFNNVSPVLQKVHSLIINIDTKSLIMLHACEGILVGFILVVWNKNSMQIADDFGSRKYVTVKYYIFSIIILGMSLMNIGEQNGSEFLYFNF